MHTETGGRGWLPTLARQVVGYRRGVDASRQFIVDRVGARDRLDQRLRSVGDAATRHQREVVLGIESLRARGGGGYDVADPEKGILHSTPVSRPFLRAVYGFLDQQPLYRVQVRGAEETAALLDNERDDLAVLRMAGEGARDDLQLGALTPLVLRAMTDHSVDASSPAKCPFERHVSERRSNTFLAEWWQAHVLLDDAEDDLLEAAHLLRERVRNWCHAVSL